MRLAVKHTEKATDKAETAPAVKMAAKITSAVVARAARSGREDWKMKRVGSTATSTPVPGTANPPELFPAELDPNPPAPTVFANDTSKKLKV